MKRLVQTISMFALVLVMLFASVSAALAFDTSVVKSIEINGREVFTNNVKSLDVKKGDRLDISVQFTAPDTEDLKNVEVSARFVYEYSDVERVFDTTPLFEVDAGDTLYKRLSLVVPKQISEQSLDLFIMIMDKTTLVQRPIRLHIKGQRHDVSIERVLFTPQKQVQAGSYLIGKVRLENFGEFDEDDLLVAVSLPELGVSDADTIDSLKREKQVTSEELYLQVPACTKPGLYTVEVDVLYDNDRGKSRATFPVEVVKGADYDFCETEKAESKSPSVSVPTSVQQVNAGEAAVYPVVVYNGNKRAQTYVVSAEAGDWANVRIEPSNVVTVDAGQTQSVYVYAAPRHGQRGDKLLGLTVKAGNDLVLSNALKVSVLGNPESAEGSGETVKKVLEVGLIVLVVLIVLLGLIVGFNKLREDDDDEEDNKKKGYY